MNEKGFSLIELIIVIAIMAILVGVLAPNLLRYIERTKIASDTQLADSVRTAVLLALADPDVNREVNEFLSREYLGNEWVFFIGHREEREGALAEPFMNKILSKDGTDTLFGKAVAETLGYSDCNTMLNELPDEIQFGGLCDIQIHAVIVNKEQVYTYIWSENFPEGDGIYVCIPNCDYTGHYEPPAGHYEPPAGHY